MNLKLEQFKFYKSFHVLFCQELIMETHKEKCKDKISGISRKDIPQNFATFINLSSKILQLPWSGQGTHTQCVWQTDGRTDENWSLIMAAII